MTHPTRGWGGSEQAARGELQRASHMRDRRRKRRRQVDLLEQIIHTLRLRTFEILQHLRKSSGPGSSCRRGEADIGDLVELLHSCITSSPTSRAGTSRARVSAAAGDALDCRIDSSVERPLVRARRKLRAALVSEKSSRMHLT